MLRDDPIVAKYPQYLPTEEEVGLALSLLDQPELRTLRDIGTKSVAIAGCLKSSMLRFCWQAKEDKKRGKECADGALCWLQQCVASRQRLRMDSVLTANPFPAEFSDLYVSTIPFSVHGTDRHGHPVYIARYGRVDTGAFQRLWSAGEVLQRSSGFPVNACVLFHLRVMEYITKVVMGEESKRRGRVVDRMLVIMDFGGLGLRHIQDTSLKAFLGAISSESVPLFPETLHATVVANAPWVVSRAVWPLARQFMHPVTQAKFCVLASMKELQKKLSDFMDLENIPPYFGGRCSCSECRGGKLHGGSMWSWERGSLSTASVLESEETVFNEAGQAGRIFCAEDSWQVEEDYLGQPSEPINNTANLLERAVDAMVANEPAREQAVESAPGSENAQGTRDPATDRGRRSWIPALQFHCLRCPRRLQVCCPARGRLGSGEVRRRCEAVEVERSMLPTPACREPSNMRRPTFLPPADVKRPSFLPPDSLSWRLFGVSLLSKSLTNVAASVRFWAAPVAVCVLAMIFARMLK